MGEVIAEFVVEREKLMRILDVARLGGELDVAQFIIGEQGIEMKLLNISNTLGCHAMFSREYFSKYNCYNSSKQAKIAIPLTKLIKLIRVIGGSEYRVSVCENSVIFNDRIEVPVIGYDESRELMRYNVKEFGSGVFILPSGVEPSKYNYTTMQVPKKINLLDVEDVTFIVENGTLAIYQEDEVGHKVRQDISVVENYVGDVRIVVDATLAKRAFDSIGSDECLIGLGVDDNGRPMPVQLCSCGQGCVISIVIAPKIKEE